MQWAGMVHDQRSKHIEETCSLIRKINYLLTKIAFLFARFVRISC